MKRTVILTDGHLDKNAAKTSHGLLRYSKKYDIIGVIDSKFSDEYTDEIIPHSKHIPIYDSINSFLEEDNADNLIVGVATVGGYLPENFKEHIKAAMQHGMDIISGLHYYLGEQEEFRSLADEYGVNIKDIRKSPPLEELHYFQNRKRNMDTITIPFLGTDSSVGKRTSLISVYETLKSMKVSVAWIATGQTGLLQGADFGLPLDSITGDYMVGELEYKIWQAWKESEPDVILVEGQGSISHPAYVCGSRAVLAASQPDGVVLQHSPKREYRHYREDDIKWPMPSVEHERELIKLYSGADVIALGINPEFMDREEKKKMIEQYEREQNLPTTDALEEPEKITDAIIELLRS
ncbi:MAG: DUF1611 domain-containing protein [Candidatus Saliniplasma sp.]